MDHLGHLDPQVLEALMEMMAFQVCLDLEENLALRAWEEAQEYLVPLDNRAEMDPKGTKENKDYRVRYKIIVYFGN